MATYRDIAPTEDQVEAFVTAELAQAWTDNAIAIAEGANIAPYDHYGWIPYNGVSVNDGATGIIYDFPVDGTVTTITTPNFVDGYEYKLLLERLNTSTNTAKTLNLDLYGNVDLFYGTDMIVKTTTAAQLAHTGTIEILRPREAYRSCAVSSFISCVDTNAINYDGARLESFNFTESRATAQKRNSARLFYSVDSINLGRVIMLKRKTFV